MRFHVAVLICFGLAGCADTTRSDEAGSINISDGDSILFRYVRIPPHGFPLASSYILGAGGLRAPFTDVLGDDVTVHDLAAHIRASKDYPGGPILFIYVPYGHPEVVLRRASGWPLQAIDEAASEAGVSVNDVQVILHFAPIRHPSYQETHAETQAAGDR